MKCANCSNEVVIPDGKDAGFCVTCGTPFRVDQKTGAQILDDSAVDRIAGRVVDITEERRLAESARLAAEQKEKEGEHGDEPKDKWKQ